MRTSVRYGAVAVGSFLLDTALLWLVQAVTGTLVPAIVVARLVSAGLNVTANRLFVFGARDVPWRQALVRYAALAGLLLLGNVASMGALTGLGLPVVAAKVVTEGSLFVCSFLAQRFVVFARSLQLRPVGI